MPSATESSIVTPREIQVDWSGSIELGLWQRLVDAGMFHSGAAETAASESAATAGSQAAVLPPPPARVDIGPILPEEGGAYVSELSVIRSKGSQTVRFHLHLRQRPKSEPPKWVRDADGKAGHIQGFGELLSLLRQAAMPPIGTYRVAVLIDGSQYQSKAIPREPAPDDPILELGRAVRLEQVGYRLDEGPAGIAEITVVFYHLSNKFSVTIDAKAILDDQDFPMQYARSICDVVLRTLFKRAGDLP